MELHVEFGIYIISSCRGGSEVPGKQSEKGKAAVIRPFHSIWLELARLRESIKLVAMRIRAFPST